MAVRHLNQVVLQGNLTRDPELKATTNGIEFCRFSLAVNRSYKNESGDWVDKPSFVDIVAWRGLASFVGEYFTKGKPAIVVGRLESSSWEQDGIKRSKLEVVANDVMFVGSNTSRTDSASDNNSNQGTSKPADDGSSQGEASAEIDLESQENLDPDDIPF